jgi:hypothetical protein
MSLQVEYYPGEEITEISEAEHMCDMLLADELSNDFEVAHDEDHEIDTTHVHTKIVDSLAELGFYARSMKPAKGWLGEGTLARPCLRPDRTQQISVCSAREPPISAKRHDQHRRTTNMFFDTQGTSGPRPERKSTPAQSIS